MATIESKDEYWFEISNLSIHDAAFWMCHNFDPRDHNSKIDSDNRYENHYLDHPGGEGMVVEKCYVLESAAQAGYIRLTENAPRTHLRDFRKLKINKLDWIKWCNENGYTNLSKLFLKTDKLKTYNGLSKITNGIEEDSSFMKSVTAVGIKLSNNSKINKLNRNILDPVIDLAIEQAGNLNVADVFLRLKELAILSTPPFNGVIEGDGLIYTNVNDVLKNFTKGNLASRLNRRKENK